MSNTEVNHENELRPSPLPEEFVFEDEHPQLKVPFTAVVADRKLEGDSLSLTKAEVTGLLSPSLSDREELVSLRFDFEGFSVNLFAEATVKIRGESDDPKISLVFTDPMGDHLPPLRYILNSFIAGDFVTIGPLLGFTGPTKVKASKPQENQSFLRKATSIARIGILGGLGFVLATLAGNIVFERIAYKYEASPITLMQDGGSLRATASGQITYINADATKGDVAYSISSNSGDLLSTKMPCDCDVIASNGFFEGSTVLAGDTIMKLVSEDAALVGMTSLSGEGAARFIKGDLPELVLQNGVVLPVELTFLENAAGAGSIGASVTLPEEYSSVVQSGEIGRLRFHNKSAAAFKGFFSQNIN